MKSKKGPLYFYILLGFCALGLTSYMLFKEHVSTRNFRNGDQWITSRRFFEPQCLVNLVTRNPELQDLRISGSAYINMRTLDALVKEKGLRPDQFYVFDLTTAKMPYVDHNSLKWYGYKELSRIQKPIREESWFRHFFLSLKASYYEWTTGKKIEDLKPEDLKSEKELIEKRGYHYLEPMPANWLDDWSFVDTFIAIFEKMPDDAWLYFHCAHGHGRTTTIMLLYDIFKSNHKVTLSDILKRQYCIGGEDVRDTKVWKNGTWDENELKAREQIIYFFYDYMNDPEGYPKKSFMAWKAKRDLLNPAT